MACSDHLTVKVLRARIIILLDAAIVDISHPDLLSLIDKRSSGEHLHEGTEHLGRADAVLPVIAVKRDLPGLVMVGKEARPPAIVLQLLICLHYALLHGERRPCIDLDDRRHERYAHIKLMPGLACVIMVIGELPAIDLPHSHHMVRGEGPPVQLADVSMRTFPVAADIHREGKARGEWRLRGIREARSLLKVAYRIDAEAIHALLSPPSYYRDDLLPQLLALPVEIWLLL